jgi:Dynein light chain type 1.
VRIYLRSVITIVEGIFICLGEGEWQCIIGTHFGASLTYDTKCLVMLDFPDYRKTVMLFRSG